MSAHEEVRAFMTDPMLQQRLAKYLVLQCFRNSMLEDHHAGTSPSSAFGDYSDVTVSSPCGVIPWPKVSRLDDEIRRLMIDVVDRTYRFIHTLFDENTGGQLFLLSLAHRDPLPQRKEPKLLTGKVKTGHGLRIKRARHVGLSGRSAAW